MKQSGTKTWRFGCVHCVIFGYHGFETALLLCRWSNYRRSAFLWFERNPVKGHRDMTQNPTYVTITRSTFMNKKTISFHAYQANRLEQ